MVKCMILKTLRILLETKGVMYTLEELETEKCVRNAGCHVHTMGAGD